MFIGSWAFTGQARETVKERGKAKGRMNRDTSLSKKIIFKAGLKLCETEFSGIYIHLAHLLTSKSKIKSKGTELVGKQAPGSRGARHCRQKEGSGTR